MLIDDRIGSADLVSPLKRLGVPASLSRLDFADAAFPGRGPNEAPIMVGIEVKTIHDILQCMTTGRFAAHQLPGLIDSYDDIWLVVEGQWKAARDGSAVMRGGDERRPHWFPLRTGPRGWMWRDIHGWLTTMATLAGVRVWQTQDRDETVRALASIYHWWTDKAFEDHKSLRTFHDYKGSVGLRRGRAQLSAPSEARRLYKELPGVGWERSSAVEEAFPSPLDAFLADVDTWQRIDGIGPKTAEKIVRAIRGRGRSITGPATQGSR